MKENKKKNEELELEELETYESDLDDQEKKGKNPDDKDEEKPVKKSGFLGKFFSFLIGLILGIALVGGAVGGAAYYVYNQPVKDTVKLVDGYVNGNLYEMIFGTDSKTGILDEKYAELKIKDLLGDSVDAVKNLTKKEGNGTLGDLNEISPAVEKALKSVLKQIDKYGIPLTTDGLLTTPTKSLASYFETQLKATALGDMLSGFNKNGSALNDDTLFNAFCYGKEGEDYDVINGEIVMREGSKKTTLGDLLSSDGLDEALNNIYLKDALEIKDDSEHKVLISLAYGEEGIDYEIDENGLIQVKEGKYPRTIGQLRTMGGDLINGIPLSDIMSEDRDSNIVMYLLYGKKDIHYAIDNNNEVVMLQRQIAVLGTKAYNEYGEALGGNVSVANGTYIEGDTTFTFDPAAPVGTVKTADGDATTYYLTNADGKVYYKKTSLGDMAGSDNLISNLTKRLTVGEIFDDDTMDTNRFLKHVKDETIDSLPTAIDNLTIQTVYKDKIDPDDDGVITGTWWYLLHKDGVMTDPKISEMDNMVENLKANVHESTISQLQQDGMITGLTGDLTTPIKTNIAGVALDLTGTGITDSMTIGDLTVSQMFNYVNAILDAI